jgi:hypothetical protein
VFDFFNSFKGCPGNGFRSFSQSITLPLSHGGSPFFQFFAKRCPGPLKNIFGIKFCGEIVVFWFKILPFFVKLYHNIGFLKNAYFSLAKIAKNLIIKLTPNLLNFIGVFYW